MINYWLIAEQKLSESPTPDSELIKAVESGLGGGNKQKIHKASPDVLTGIYSIAKGLESARINPTSKSEVADSLKKLIASINSAVSQTGASNG